MTNDDEAIAELFRDFMSHELPDETVFLAAMLATEHPKNYENVKREAYGFIEGYRVAIAKAEGTLDTQADKV